VAIHYFKGAQEGKAFYSLAVDSQAFSGELVWFAPLLGRGNNLDSIYYVRPKIGILEGVKKVSC
jgi:hypothetical protein